MLSTSSVGHSEAAAGGVSSPPAILYHGTDADFKDFAYTEDIGFHFGSLATAEERLRSIGGGEWPVGASVRPVALTVRRPLRLPDLLDWNPQAVAWALFDAGVITADEQRTGIIDRDQVAAWLKRDGLDGIVYRNETEDGGDSWIVFRARQIRPWWHRPGRRQ